MPASKAAHAVSSDRTIPRQKGLTRKPVSPSTRRSVILGRVARRGFKTLSGFQLLAVEVVIHPLLFHQTVVVALFDDGAFLHHDDSIRIAHSRQPVSDDQGRPVFEDSIQVLLNGAFTFTVQ